MLWVHLLAIRDSNGQQEDSRESRPRRLLTQFKPLAVSTNGAVLHSFPRVLNFENMGIDFDWLPRFTNKAIELQLQ
jgi:hypothetical protein